MGWECEGGRWVEIQDDSAERFSSGLDIKVNVGHGWLSSVETSRMELELSELLCGAVL